MIDKFVFACPQCGIKLERITAVKQQCPQDGQEYCCIDGIWRFLLPQRQAHFAQFVKEYETVRQAEGRGSTEAAYYRALPFADLTGKMTADWQIRAQSFQVLLQQVVGPLAEKRPCRILDLGAGNGWLSYRLAQRGHHVAAVDLTVNRFDGLGTHPMYDASFLPVQAEFDHLPFAGGQADLAIFNASLHYTSSYERTLREALRVVRPEGMVVVVDTAVYHDESSGAQMVREREAHFQQTYGFPSNAIAAENYLTYERIEAVAKTLSVSQRLLWPVPGWRRAVRKWRARLNGRREPAQFPLIVLQPAAEP